MVTIPIQGADPTYERRIRSCLSNYPTWFVKAARVSKIIISNRPEVKEQIAMYEHGVRTLSIAPGVGDILLKAIGHELAHGIDDIFGEPHHFTGMDEWKRIHANQPYFDISKYMQEPLEYFADMVVKLFLLGADKLRTTNPDEVRFIGTKVFPVLIENYK